MRLNINKENCLKSLLTKKLSRRVKFIELDANPPKALYNEAGRFFVLKTIEVITFFFKPIFFTFF